jgi:hypothetical protein
MPYYFVRVNGNTSHNNPNDVACYVQGEPPRFPVTYFNYYRYCLNNKIVRIGWPDVGDILAGNKVGALATCYDLYNIDNDPIKTRRIIKEYLVPFSQIPLKSIILMPNKDNPGELYCGEVIKTYWYHHNIPADPYECSHRVGVEWDRDGNKNPIIYHASQFNMSTRGTPFAKAFCEIKKEDIIKAIHRVRLNK